MNGRRYFTSSLPSGHFQLASPAVSNDREAFPFIFASSSIQIQHLFHTRVYSHEKKMYLEKHEGEMCKYLIYYVRAGIMG